MKVAVVEYNAGNVQSVLFALKRLGVSANLTSNPEELKSADKVIFPGVGEASSTMRFLRARKLNQLIPALTQPVLGICLGLQLLCSYSEENNTECLGVFPEQVKRFVNPPGQRFKIPHIGWNSLVSCKGALFKGVPENSYVYFVHSYCAEIGVNTVSQTEYASTFSSALEKDNFYAVQFHPEKSSATGQIILNNFLSL